MIDARSKTVTWIKWVLLFFLGYFLLHPIAGIYEKSDYRDVIFMLTFVAGIMGVDVPLTFFRRMAWKKDVEKALHTEPPKQ